MSATPAIGVRAVYLNHMSRSLYESRRARENTRRYLHTAPVSNYGVGSLGFTDTVSRQSCGKSYQPASVLITANIGSGYTMV